MGFKLFVRRSGRYSPSKEARGVFRQINEVHNKVDDLQVMLAKLDRGHDAELQVGSVPSIAQVMVPRAVVAMQSRYPELHFNIELLKIEEAIDYLMLERGEVIFMSYRLDHPSIIFEPLSQGKLVFIVPPDHAEAGRKSISVREIARYPLIGIDPKDPYGRIMADLFDRHSLEMSIPIKARFGTTVAALVERHAGVAVLDSFSVSGMRNDRLRVIPIEEDTQFQTYVATRRELRTFKLCRAFHRGDQDGDGPSSRPSAANALRSTFSLLAAACDTASVAASVRMPSSTGCRDCDLPSMISRKWSN